MADMTETLLSEAIVELKKGNQLREQGNRDPSLPSSIRQNLGEILNARELATRGESFAKQEGTTEVDEKVDALKDTNETFLSKILQSVNGIFVKQPSTSQRMSKTKQERSFLKNLFEPVKNLGKDLKETFSFLTNEKGGLFDFGGFLGKVKLLALLAALPFFLDSKFFGDMLETIDNVIIPAIKRLNDKLKPIGDALNKVGEMLGVEGLGDTLGKVALAAGGFSIISKRFRNFVGSFLGLFFSPKNNILSRIARFGSDQVKAVDKNGKEYVKNIKTGMKVEGKNIKGFGRKLVDGLAKGLRVGLKAFPLTGIAFAIFDGLLGGLKAFAEGEDFLGVIKGIGKGIIDGFLFPFTFVYGLIEGFLPEGVRNAIQNTVTEIKSRFAAVGEFFGGLFDRIVKLNDMLTFEIKIPSISDIKKDIKDFLNKIENIIPTFPDIRIPDLNFDFIDDIVKFFKAIGQGAAAAFKAALPGGKTPQEAFAETFDSVMNTGTANDFFASSETGGNADAMNENALNKMGGGQTTVVTTASIDNSNNSKVESVQHNMKQIAHTDPIQQQIANAT